MQAIQSIVAATPQVVSAVCPVCASGDHAPLVDFPELTFARCRDCETIFKSRQLESLGRGYEADYFQRGGAQYLRRWEHRVRKCRRQLLAALEFAPQAQRVLDVGCSAGYVLEAARRLGLEAAGVDISSFAVEFCRGRGHRAEVGELERLPFADGAFDIVTAKHTLEHTSHPLRALAEFKRVLRPGGVVFLVVPDADYFKRFLMPRRGPYFRPSALGWQHCVYYGDTQLAEVVRRAGFEPLKAGKGIYRRRLARGPALPWEALRFAGVTAWNQTARALHLRREIQLIARRPPE